MKTVIIKLKGGKTIEIDEMLYILLIEELKH